MNNTKTRNSACCAALILLSLAGQQAAQHPPEWLSLCGQCLNPDVNSKSDIGTKNAVVEARITRAGAKGWCENWQPGSNIDACLKQQLSSDDAKKTFRVTADCTTGHITAIDGKTYTYAGTWTNDVGKGRSKWRDGAGAVVGQDEGSGGLAISQQWELLCPASPGGRPATASSGKSK